MYDVNSQHKKRRFSMRKGFHVVPVLFVLLAFFAVQSAMADVTISASGQSVNIPCTGMQNVIVNEAVSHFFIYDNGGTAGNYSNNCNGYLSISSRRSDYAFMVTGSMDVGNSNHYDTLRLVNFSILRHDFYDNRYVGTMYRSTKSENFGPLYTTKGNLVAQFVTNPSDVYSGLNIRVDVVPLHNINFISSPNGRVDVWDPYYGSGVGFAYGNINAMLAGSKVSLRVQPDSGYFLSSLKVRGPNAQLVHLSKFQTIRGHEYDSVQFTMPEGGVTVTPVFSSKTNFSSVDMLCWEDTLDVPSTVRSFKIYDDGGADDPYTNNCSAHLLLRFPEGYHAHITGTAATEHKKDCLARDCDDLFYFSQVSSEEDGVPFSKTYTASSGSTAISFTSNESKVYSGLDFTVTLIPDTFSLNIYPMPNGYVTSEKSSAATGSTVTLKAWPDEGYMLDSIFVATEWEIPGIKRKVATSGGWYTNNTVTFTMPAADVMIEGVFARDKYQINKSTVSGGSVSGPDSAKFNTEVSMTANPSNGYLLKDLSVVDAKNNLLKVSSGLWYSSSKNFSFTMPMSDVSVKPVFTKDWSAAGGLYINMPTSGTISATIPEGVKSFKIYDDGGKDGNYSNNCFGILVLTAPEGYVLQLNGNMNTYTSSYLTAGTDDYLNVYDGTASSSAVLLNQAKSFYTKVMSSGRTMVLYFHSDSLGTASGLDLTVTLHKLAMELEDDGNGGKYVNMLPRNFTTLDIPEGVKSFKIYDDGGKDVGYSNNCFGILVLTAPEGYVLQLNGNMNTYTSSYSTAGTDDYLNVYDGTASSSAVLLNQAKSIYTKVTSSGRTMVLYFHSDSSGTASGLDLTVTLHKLAMELEDDGNGGKYVNMLPRNFTTLDIPEGVKSFKIYDDGGKDVGYSNNCFGILVLTAPEGYVLQLEGSVRAYTSYSTTGTDDYLTVYDGTASSSPMLLDRVKSFDGRVVGTNRNMVLYFHSDSSGTASGLDLTITLVNYTIDIKSLVQGTVVSDKETAIPNDVVTLTAAPINNKFLLGRVGVKDSLNKAVHVLKHTFYTAEFSMPASNVTVSPALISDLTAEGGLYLDMARGKKTVIDIPLRVKSFKVYDNGGVDSAYANDSKDTLVLRAPAGYRMKVEGLITTELKTDSLYIFDGANTSSPILYGSASLGSGGSTIEPISTSGKYVTLLFESNETNRYAGFELKVSLEQIEYPIVLKSVSGGRLDGPEKDTLGAEVNLRGTGSGSFHLSGVTVVDKDGNLVKSSMYSFYSAKFTMPASEVTVTPTWTNNLTAQGGLHLDMLRNHREVVNIPDGIKSFKLYDNGGKDSVYRNWSDDTLTLIAPYGYGLKVTGNINLENNSDSLYIYDGTGVDAPLLYGGCNPVKGPMDTDIGTVGGYSRSLTFRMKSDNAVNFYGLDLTVLVEPITYNVTINPAQNGRVYSDKTNVMPDSVVTLTWEPNRAYGLKELLVKDSDGDTVNVTGGWYSDSATFVMPERNVTVYSTFTKNLTAEGGLYVNIPKTGTLNATIPFGVQSFKVYDDGGALGNYSNNCTGSIVLTAPEDYIMEVSGTMRVKNSNTSGFSTDNLSIHNGSSIDSPALYPGALNGGFVTLTNIRSRGRVMMLHFYSDGSGVSDGLNLTVTLVKARYGAISLAMLGGKQAAVLDGMYDGTDGIWITKEFDVDSVVFARKFPVVTDAYSTIVLPFDVNTSKVSGPKQVLKFGGMDYVTENGVTKKVVVMNVAWDKDTSSTHADLAANTPYMVLMEDEAFNVAGPVTMKKSVMPVVREGDWEFRGTLQYKQWLTGDTALGRVYGFSAEKSSKVDVGKFVKAGPGAWIRPLRAYLIYTPQDSAQQCTGGACRPAMPRSVVDASLPENIDVVIKGADGEQTTVIGRINTRTGEFKAYRTFDLKGRKVNGRPKARGVYLKKSIGRQ